MVTCATKSLWLYYAAKPDRSLTSHREFSEAMGDSTPEQQAPSRGNTQEDPGRKFKVRHTNLGHGDTHPNTWTWAQNNCGARRLTL